MPMITIVILVNSTQDKARQEKVRHDEICLDSLHIMTMTMTATMTMSTTMTTTMTIIIQ